MKIRSVVFLKIFMVFILTGSSSILYSEQVEKDSAVLQAEEEALIMMKQLSFEKEEAYRFHMEKGENFLLAGDLEKAELEFKEVLNIVEKDKRAASYLDYIARLKQREKLRKEKLVETEKRLELKEEKRETEEALRQIEREKKEEDRKAGVDKRKRDAGKELKIDKYLRSGKEFYSQEKYDEAISEWEKVLDLLDPSNPDYQRAMRWMHIAKVAGLRKLVQDTRPKKKEFEEEVFLDVEKAWTREKTPEREKEEAEREILEKVSEAKLKLEKKARQPVTIDFKDAHLRAVLRYLSNVSGINIVLDENVFPSGEEGVSPAGRVTIGLKDIPLIDALDVILRTKGLNYRLEENVIWITTEENIAGGQLIMRSYKPAGGLTDIVDMLLKTVPFDMEGVITPDTVEGAAVSGPPGSMITVDRTAGIIFITNTEVNHRLAEDIIRKLATAAPQVSIETRFMEIKRSALQQLGIQWKFDEPFEGATGDSVIGGEDEDTGIGTEVGVDEDEQDRGIFIKYTKLTGTQFEAILQSFESTGSANLLSAPKLTVINNYSATIELATQFPYIGSFSIQTETIEIGGDELKISTPIIGDVQERSVGVKLQVTPGIGADRKTINLTLVPEIVDLVDWLEYGSELFRITQPVFAVRYITTNVDINDGETLLLGGLIKGSEFKNEEYIPFLGRIPIIGNLFRRKSTESEKKELFVFVTARIIEPTGQPLVR